jgi:hypothetical protein
VILRRRGDYARVLRELGGQLFARKGNVDKYFERKAGDWRPWDDVPRELTGDARIAAEKRALALWLDREFEVQLGRLESSPRESEEDERTLRLIRITERIRERIFHAPEREAVALRVANIFQLYGVPPKGWPR